MKHIERLKKMVKWAGLKGWCEKDVFAEFKIKIKRKETEYLVWEQLRAIEDLVLIDPLTKLVRAIFVFCCYTGMAPIDVQSLKPSQLSKDMFGNLWMTYTRTKSEVPAWVPLLDKAKEIVSEYGMEEGATYRETVFKYVSNKVINDHLKIIGLACGFDFKLRAYAARHTFGTIVTTQLGVPIEVTQIKMGHEDIESTMIYSRVGNPLVLMYMPRVQQKINSGMTIGINGINEEQFLLLLEKIAPKVLENVFTNEIMPKLLEIVHKNPAPPQLPLPASPGVAV